MDPRLSALARDLQRIFGARLQSLVTYGDPADTDGVHTLALVERLSFEDLTACAPHVSGWQRAGLAVPLLLSRDEFVRTLDVFPIEYGYIIATHALISGDAPFTGMTIRDADLRRACELQTKSHLIHLREGYLESSGQTGRIGGMMAASAPALRALVRNLDRLEPGTAERAGMTPAFIDEIAAAGDTTIADPSALLSRYIDTVGRLWEEVDTWRGDTDGL